MTHGLDPDSVTLTYHAKYLGQQWKYKDRHNYTKQSSLFGPLKKSIIKEVGNNTKWHEIRPLDNSVMWLWPHPHWSNHPLAGTYDGHLL